MQKPIARKDERIRATKRQQLGGRPPFGWKHSSSKDHTLVAVPNEQTALLRIRQLHIKGVSTRRISTDLADAFGIRLSHVSVAKIIAGWRTMPKQPDDAQAESVNGDVATSGNQRSI